MRPRRDHRRRERDRCGARFNTAAASCRGLRLSSFLSTACAARASSGSATLLSAGRELPTRALRRSQLSPSLRWGLAPGGEAQAKGVELDETLGVALVVDRVFLEG